MLTVEEAQRAAIEDVAVLPAERMALLDALGCALAEPIVSPIDCPPFDNSAMDGYAVVAADTEGATPVSPRTLTVIEELPAGTAPTRRVAPGTAARIMTGAPIPPGADAVVIVEATRERRDGAVEVLHDVRPGDNVRPVGEDLRAGDLAIPSGALLGPAELGLAAGLGCTEVVATRRPRVAIITSGSELVEPGRPLPQGAIYNSNLVTLSALVGAEGAEVTEARHVPDEEEAVAGALRECREGADLIITAGGVSVGKYDYVKAALQRLGDVGLWRVRMKPGKPVAFGHVLGCPVFGLPGNPVSCMVTYEVLAGPALRKMAGRRDIMPTMVQARLTRDLRHKPGRREYVRAATSYAGGEFISEPSPKRGSAMIGGAVGTNSLVVIPEGSEGLAAGETVSVVLVRHRGMFA